MSPASFAFPVLLAAAAQAPAAALPCPVQPMPPAIEAVPAAPPTKNAIAFAATPWEYPGRAWVVRLFGGPRGTGKLEIIRLRRQDHCNRWDLERRWEASVTDAEHRTMADALAPLAAPPAGFLARDPAAGNTDELVMDGTALELRWRRDGWDVRRHSNHYAADGGRISAQFHALVARHLPSAELPAEDWRNRAR